MNSLRSFALALLAVIPALTSSPVLADDAKSHQRLTGVWRGWYHYPGDTPAPVSFQLVLAHDGPALAGFIKEPNSFGKKLEPWLHARVKGRFDDKAGKLTFTKTYDGTAGESHDVEYTGELSRDGAKVEGTWDISGFSGRYTLEKIADTRSGPFSGVWSGAFEYPKDSKQEPVKVHIVTVHHGKTITGLVTEPNTTGKNKDEPLLYSVFRGHLDEKTGKITFTRSYDGTAGEDREIECSGEIVRKEGRKVEAGAIARLIKQLASSKFEERENASKGLEEIGPDAYDAVREAADKADDVEAVRRLRELLPKLQKLPKVEGVWTLPDGGTGRFTLQKIRLAENALGNEKK